MIIILLPAYNEEDSLPGLFPKLEVLFKHSKEEYQIIV